MIQKLTNEELDWLTTLQKDYSNVTLELGSIEIQKIELDNKKMKF